MIQAPVTLQAAFKALAFRLWADAKDSKTPPSRLRKCVRILGHDRTLDTIDAGAIDDLSYTLKETLSHATVNRHLSALRKFLKACRRRGWLQEVPEEFPYLREPPGRTRWLTDDEVPTVLALLRGYPGVSGVGRAAAAFFQISLETGMRRGEILKVDPERHISEFEGRYYLLIPDDKAGQNDTIEISRESASLLRAYAPWGLRQTGSRNFPDRYYAAWAYAKANMGLAEDTELVPHVTRHTAATWMVEKGISTRAIQAELRHKSSKTTERYAKVTPRARGAAAEARRGRLGELI